MKDCKYIHNTFPPLVAKNAASMPWDVVPLGAVGSGVRTSVKISSRLWLLFFVGGRYPNKNLFKTFIINVPGKVQ